MDAKRTGALIARQRRELGLSQAELAARLHVTDKAISRWETGRGMPSLDSLEPLAEALDLSVSELLSGRRLDLEELPREAGKQLVDTMKWDVRRLRIAAVVLAAAVAALAAGWVGIHWFTSADGADWEALSGRAVRYLSSTGHYPLHTDTLRVVATDAPEGYPYLGALCVDDQGYYCIVGYDQDKLFPTRWHAAGAGGWMEPGHWSLFHFGPGHDSLLIFGGGALAEEAAYFCFGYAGAIYVRPIQKRQYIEAFYFEDVDLTFSRGWLLDEAYQPLES